VKRILWILVVLGAAIGGYRWWMTRPQPEPPEFVWTRQPFRGPLAYEEAGKHPPLDFTLGATSLEPPLEESATVQPDPRVYVRQSSTTAVVISEYLSWRTKFTSPDQMTSAQLAPWRVRWYVYTGETVNVGAKRWAKYQREDKVPPPR
jgi:hypothetical protein